MQPKPRCPPAPLPPLLQVDPDDPAVVQCGYEPSPAAPPAPTLAPRDPAQPHALNLTNRCGREVQVAVAYNLAPGLADAAGQCQYAYSGVDATTNTTTWRCVQYTYALPPHATAFVGSYPADPSYFVWLSFLGDDWAAFPEAETSDTCRDLREQDCPTGCSPQACYRWFRVRPDGAGAAGLVRRAGGSVSTLFQHATAALPAATGLPR